jgi:hypothetical protein
VDERLRDLYKEDEKTGRFHLQVEGFEDVTGLKSALVAERSARKEMKERLDGFAEVDVFEYRKLKEAAGKSDDGVSDDRIALLEQKLKQHEDSLSASERALESSRVENALRTVALKARVRDAAVPDVLGRAHGKFRLDDGKLVGVDESGKVRYAEDGLTPYGADQFLGELRDSASHLFRSSSGSDAGGSDGSGIGVGVLTSGDPRKFGDNLEAIAKGKLRVV